MSKTHLVAAVRAERVDRYRQQLALYPDFEVKLVTGIRAALDVLADRNTPVDVLVMDRGLGDLYDMIRSLRQTYPRLVIVLVDEEAEFATPGLADDLSTEPFAYDDLARRITRLMSDRRLETLHADAFPPVREFARRLRAASGEADKIWTVAAVCRDLGYDYAAYYRLEGGSLTLAAQDGADNLQAAPASQTPDADIVAWVASAGQSRTAGTGDALNHPLVVSGWLGAVACVPVGWATRYGVLVVGRVQRGSISQSHVRLLELLSAQLAAMIAKAQAG